MKGKKTYRMPTYRTDAHGRLLPRRNGAGDAKAKARE